MAHALQQNFGLYFPLFFVGIWALATTMLGYSSGWFHLMRIYPDCDEGAIQTFSAQSGSLGGVRMNQVLKISICRTGLRIEMLRLFGPFNKPFFVPWDEISVARKDWRLWKMAELRFGQPTQGKFSVLSHVADKYARAANGAWPEPGPFPEETRAQSSARILKTIAVSALTVVALMGFAIFIQHQMGKPGASWNSFDQTMTAIAASAVLIICLIWHRR